MIRLKQEQQQRIETGVKDSDGEGQKALEESFPNAQTCNAQIPSDKRGQRGKRLNEQEEELECIR